MMREKKAVLSEKEYLYILIHSPKLGPVSIFRLYDRFGAFGEIFKVREEMLAASGFLNEKQTADIMRLRREEEISAILGEFDELERRGVKFITFLDENYPERLKPYRDSPPALFVKGELPADDVPSVAIVGARDCTEYGRWAAEVYARVLSEEGISVVSGLAEGVDCEAHRSALKAGMKTYGVLGCGIYTCYPRENFSIYEQMTENGGVITEFVPQTAPAAGNFPRRNRIISALSDIVIVIEAREKSGSLITADLALEQGKDVMALPGRVTDPFSAGCNELIRNGAFITLSPADVLDHMGLKIMKKLTVHKISEKRLENQEKLLYSCLDLRPGHIEKIMQKSGLGLTECLESLLKLELMGFVQDCGNQYYCRKQ